MANDLSAFNAQVWSQALIANIDRLNVMLPHTNRQWEGVLNNIGDTVQVRTLGSVATASYSKGQKINYQAMSPSKESLQVNDTEYFALEVDDIDAIQNDHNALMLYTQRAAVAMSNAIEDKILSSYAGALAANQIGSSGSTITLTATTAGTSVYDNLVLAREKLALQNVPPTDRWVVVTPKITSLLLKDTTHFIRSTAFSDGIVREGTVDGQAGRPGFVGKCAGFDILESNAVPRDGSGNAFLLFGNDMAIAYVSQLQTVEAIRLQDTFASAVRGLLLHDTKVFAEASKQLGYICADASIA
jgi:uncharacterized linocin/CFP29 family protein